jgi:hypothetical protein
MDLGFLRHTTTTTTTTTSQKKLTVGESQAKEILTESATCKRWNVNCAEEWFVDNT